MSITFTVAVLITCLSVVSTFSEFLCENLIQCPCGNSGRNITVCHQEPDIDPCKKWSRCRTCENGLNICSQCSDGFKGPFCTKDVTKKKSRLKRQNSQRNSRRNRVSMCSDPGQIPNADRLNTDGSPSVSSQQFRVEESVVYTCHQGFVLENRSLITCLPSGSWSYRIPHCTRLTHPLDYNDYANYDTNSPDESLIYCDDPGTVSNGNRQSRSSPNSRGFLQGSRLDYSCLEGYHLIGEKSIFCELSGQWSDSLPGCELRPPNSRRRRSSLVSTRKADLDEYPPGTRLIYTCRIGFHLEGSNIQTCQSSSFWTPAETPRCVEAITVMSRNCNSSEPIMNGRVLHYAPGVRKGNKPEKPLDEDLNEYPAGTRLRFSCDAGFQLAGAHEAYCQSLGYWSADTPLCIPECGRSYLLNTPDSFFGRIRHGTPSIPGEWPWVVAFSNQIDEVICEGAVLNSRTLVTAAHCVENPDLITLRFGKFFTSSRYDDEEVLVRRIKKAIIHPDYNKSSTLDSDIALVTFEPRIPFSIRVQPICLPTFVSSEKNLVPGNIGYVAGWGMTHTRMPAEQLELASLPVVDREECRQFHRKGGLTYTITENMICAGYEDARQFTCEGDSGSPLVFYNSLTERYTLEGIVSFGPPGQCGTRGGYPVFTKVSVFLGWIYRTLKSQ